MPIHVLAGDFDAKVDHTDLVFGMRSGLISRSVHAILQVTVQRIRFVPPWLTSRQTDTHTYTSEHTDIDNI